LAPDDLLAGIVGIVNKSDGLKVGAGFVAHEDGLIATCAHVVDYAGVKPGGTVSLIFQATKDEREAIVVPEYWRDAKSEDVAILHLEGSLPAGVHPLFLGRSPSEDGHHFITFGFPQVQNKDGMWGYGIVGNLISTEAAGLILQLTDTTEVTPGFSGAPILDRHTNRVVGMVSAITQPDDYERLGETAFVTPTETLRAVCPALSISPDDVKDKPETLWDPKAPPWDPRGPLGPLGPLGPGSWFRLGGS
jgi:S1-C subfamily serine protease